MDKHAPQTNINNTYIYTNSLCTRPIFVNEISPPLPLDFNGCIALLYIFLLGIQPEDGLTRTGRNI